MAVLQTISNYGKAVNSCAFCGGRAKKTLYTNTNIAVNSCSNLLCDLQFLYHHKSDSLFLINFVEWYLKVEPAAVLVSHAKFEDSSIKTKAGYVFFKEKELVWTEIFVGLPMQTMIDRIKIAGSIFNLRRVIVSTNDILPEKRIDRAFFRSLNKVFH